jgi:hypothetical protein
VEVNYCPIILCMALLLLTHRINLLLRCFQLTFMFKLSYAAINLRVTVSDKSEEIWLVACFVLPEDGTHRLQRMSVITG